MTSRLKPQVRKQDIMDKAMVLAAQHGYRTITRDAIAEAASVAPSLVSRYWGTMPQLQRSIMRNAVANENLVIIAQGLIVGDKQAKKASDEVRQAAVAQLV